MSISVCHVGVFLEENKKYSFLRFLSSETIKRRSNCKKGPQACALKTLLDLSALCTFTCSAVANLGYPK